MTNKNLIIFVAESLRFDHLWNITLKEKDKMKDVLEFSKDSSIFTKCYSASNSSWMSTACILFGNNKCYQHNKIFTTDDYSSMTVSEYYSKSLFNILEKNGYSCHAFLSPEANGFKGYRLLKFNTINNEKDNILTGTIWGASQENIINSENKFENTYKVIDTLEKHVLNKTKFAYFIWNFQDNICHGSPSPDGRKKTYVDTSNQFGLIIDKLKEKNIYDNTDIYFISDHGDTYYSNYDQTRENTFMHGCNPFPTTIHVPLLIKNDYIPKGVHESLVSNIDLYATILNSLQIPFDNTFKDLPKNCYSLDIKNKQREYCLSQNMFSNQNALGGIAIVKENYFYLKTKNKQFIFDIELDPLGTSDLYRGLNSNIKSDHPHNVSWFEKNYMSNISSKILPDIKKIYENLIKLGIMKKI
jgi:arylsulfatase A-like enzyme